MALIDAAVADRDVELAVERAEADPAGVVVAGVVVDVVEQHDRGSPASTTSPLAVKRATRFLAELHVFGSRLRRIRRHLAERVVDVDEVVRREARVERDAEEPALEEGVEVRAGGHEVVQVEERLARAARRS